MKRFNFPRKITIFMLFSLFAIVGFTQEHRDDWTFNPKIELDRDLFKDFWGNSNNVSIYRGKINETTFFAKADSVLNAHPEDSTSFTEFVKLYRGALDLFTYEDPHFRIYPLLIRHSDNTEAMSKNYNDYILALPFNILQINDSLLIDKSLSKELFKGDLILSVNGIDAQKLLNYTYKDRYIDASMMQLQNNMMFSRYYDLKLIRNGKIMELNVTGVSLNEYNKLLTNRNDITTRIIGDVGYVSIEEFIKNKRIINELREFIKEVQNIGGHSIIIDIRKNLGGSGEDFDKLMSIFTPAKEIDYMKDVKRVVARKRDSIKEIVSLPDSKIFKKIPLKPKLYMGEMDYYVLMSTNTGSEASSFANIMQYNNLGILVGEPLRHNATHYGDINRGTGAVQFIYSTIRYDEYTKAIDGIIYPDINIPYNAGEYMKGGDPILEKLLEIIKGKVNLE